MDVLTERFGSSTEEKMLVEDSPHSSVDEPEPTENVENNLAKGLPFATSSSIETEAAERDKNDMNGDQGDNDDVGSGVEKTIVENGENDGVSDADFTNNENEIVHKDKENQVHKDASTLDVGNEGGKSLVENGTAPAHDKDGCENGTETLRNLLMQKESLLPDTDENQREGEQIETISDDSETENNTDSAVVKGPEQDVNEIRNIILKAMSDQQPRVFSELEKLSMKDTTVFGQQVQFARIHCTACNKHLGSALSNQGDRCVHPILKVLVCKSCCDFYTSGEFEKDEDGSELYCRWCGQGGKVICCSKCEYVFCVACIRTNFGVKRLQQIKNSDDWCCFLCDDSQLCKSQMLCSNLFEYVHSQLTRLAGSNDPTPYTVDHASCCIPRKRKVSASKDTDFDPAEELSLRRKAKKAKTYQPPVPSTPILDCQEQEEVVCAPDLLSFMDEDDAGEGGSEENPPLQLPPPVHLPAQPVLMPNIPVLGNYRLVTPVFVPSTGGMLVQNPAAIVQPQPAPPLILNTTVKAPITPQNVCNSLQRVPTHKITLKASNRAHPKLMPGLQYEWFDNAAKNSGEIQAKLSIGLSKLSMEKSEANTIDDLARIHNKFQEILSNTINAMIMVRKGLRTNFLASLKELKFVKSTDKDDDVVFVNSTGPTNPPEHRGPYLKVRTMSQLHNLPSECITIPDDVEKPEDNKEVTAAPETEPQKEEEKSHETVCDISSDSNKENVENFSDKTEENVSKEAEDATAEKTEESTTEKTARAKEFEMTPEIRVALFESKMEKFINDNLKYNVSDMSGKEKKRALSAYVCLAKGYKRKVRPEKVNAVSFQDFEDLLDGSVVLKNGNDEKQALQEGSVQKNCTTKQDSD